MVAKDHTKMTGSPNVEVGEIDTSAPFQSVKDAVNLFGEGTFSGKKPAIKKPKQHSAEIPANETQLHVAKKELNKLKEQLENAETTKAQVLVELKGAKWTVEDLNHKFKFICESKDSSINATVAAKNQVKQLEEASDRPVMGMDGSDWKVDLETAREKYTEVVTDLDTAKQELRKIRQDGDTAVEEIASAIKQAAEAEDIANANMERAGELSKEILALQESIEQLKLACVQEREQEAKIYVEKDFKKQSYKANLEEAAKELLALRKDFDADLTKSLEAQFAETMSEIESLQKEKDCARSSDLVLVRAVTTELGDAKESLHKVAEEESMLQTLVEYLKLELEKAKKEHSDLKEKEVETESLADSLHVKLQKSKSELDVAVTEESKFRGTSEEMMSAFHQLTLETENVRLEAERMAKQADELKKEADTTRIAFEEAENRLKAELEEAEEAKSAEGKALDQSKILFERTVASRASTSESGACTISKDEFDSLSRKVEESKRLAEMKVAAAMAQLEAVKASEYEALKRLEATEKEIEDMKTYTQEVLKKAEMAESAKKAVENELRRWREREQKKAAEAASRILAETQMTSGSSPHNYRSEKENMPEKSLESHLMKQRPAQKAVEPNSQNPPEKKMELHKLQKAKTSVSNKVLMPNISGIFHKKKNQVEGNSASYHPEEKLVC